LAAPQQAQRAAPYAGPVFTLEIITPERRVLTESVTSLVVPTAEGYVGVLAHHAPMVAAVHIGVMRYRRDDEWHAVAVSGGFMEVAGNRAIVLARTAETAGEIDVMRAQAALKRARERLADRSAGIDHARAENAMMRALARIRAAGH